MIISHLAVKKTHSMMNVRVHELFVASSGAGDGVVVTVIVATFSWRH
jgi:hypothetical protein